MKVKLTVHFYLKLSFGFVEHPLIYRGVGNDTWLLLYRRGWNRLHHFIQRTKKGMFHHT
jgi:hypothetical protein